LSTRKGLFADNASAAGATGKWIGTWSGTTGGVRSFTMMSKHANRAAAA
jgi:hypothetical protein